MVPRPASQMGWTARRPAYSVLGSERGTLLPPLESVLDRFCGECELQWAPEPAALAASAPAAR